MLPTGIKNMKAFLANRGVSIRSGTEKPELQALVQQHAQTPLISRAPLASAGGSSATAPLASAGGSSATAPLASAGGSSATASLASAGGRSSAAAQRKVRAILLASHHNSIASSTQNIMVLQRLLEQHLEKNPGLTPQTAKVDFCRTSLLVSEGRGISAEYTMFGFRVPCVLQEFETSTQTEVEVIDRFLLMLELFDAISKGDDIGNGVPVSEEKTFMKERALNDGYRPMLARMKETAGEGMALFEEFLDVSFECKTKNKPVQAYEEKLQELLTAVTQKYLAHKPELQAVVEEIRNAPDRKPLLKAAFTRCRNLRDAAIFGKIKDRLAANTRINTVFIILGKAHYNNFRSLLEADSLFSFDSTVSSNSAPENTPSAGGGAGSSRKRKSRRSKRSRNSRRSRRSV